MRSVWISRHGGPEVLELREAEDPSPKAGELRVRVRATGINFADLAARQGLYPEAPKGPFVPGYEIAGVVDAVGEGVSDLPPGARVVGLCRFGGYTDTICLERAFVREMPSGMSFDEAAALPVNYLTAYHMLFRTAQLREGHSLLIHMAAGGVGLAALELSKTVRNVTTFGTASAGKHDFLREQGLTHPIDYRSVDYADEIRRLTQGRGVDIILDALGGADWKKGYRLLAKMGHLVAFGFANATKGETPSYLGVVSQLARMPFFSPWRLMSDNKSVSGVHLGRLFDRRDVLAQELDDLLKLYEARKIRPHIDSTYKLKDAASAHRRLHERKNVGKVLLVP